MSRKARVDKTSWRLPTVHVFAGDYGPFRPRGSNGSTAIEGALVLLTATVPKDDANDEDDRGGVVRRRRRHAMYEHAIQAQNILLGEGHPTSDDVDPSQRRQQVRFRHLMIVDLADMVGDGDDRDHDAGVGVGVGAGGGGGESLKDLIRKEVESREPTRGFGKTLVRLFQRMDLRNVVLAAEGELCPVLLKLHDALGPGLASDVWLLHPVLSAGFVNAHLVPMGERERRRLATITTTGKSRGNHGGEGSKQQPVRMHLVFQDDASRDRRSDMIRHVFPAGTTNVIPPRVDGRDVFLSVFGDDDDHPELGYDPDRFDSAGRSLFLSTMRVEINAHTKQYERKCEDVTAELLKVEIVEAIVDGGGIGGSNPGDVVDWDSCERYVGGLVLRGNRCVLVRSLTGEWSGMRFPSVRPRPGESTLSAAIRAVVECTGVEESEFVPVGGMIPPATVYGPGGRRIVIQLVPLYATSPPPDGPLEDADIEDDETEYDWYTLPNALGRLDLRSGAALMGLSLALVEAANVGALECKWGGVFGQELAVSIRGEGGDRPGGVGGGGGLLTAPAERWEPPARSRVDEEALMRDVREANAAISSRLLSDHPRGEDGGRPRKLPVTLLSGFLGSGKTTLLAHILSNYDGLRVAVMVNDMAEVNIDAAVVRQHSVSVTQREEHLVELSNGCICCTLREDLLVEVAKIASQGFDYLIIESSGVSEPMPVAETFTFEDSNGMSLGDVARIDTLVTVVDGSKFLSELDSILSLREKGWHTTPEDQRTISHLLCDQVEFANVIVINKCDLISVDEKGRIESVIRQMNPSAKLIESVHSKIPLEYVLGTGLFSLTEAETHARWLKEARIGEHTPETIEYGISSFTYRARRPFSPNKLAEALDAMIDKTAPFDESIVLRAKGFVWLASFSSVQGDFSLAGSQYALTPGNPWWAEIDREHWPPGLEDALVPPLWQEPFGDRQQEIVIIGQSLDKKLISRVLDDCLLTDDEMRKDKDAWVQMCADAGDPFYEDWYNAIESFAGNPENVHSHDHHHEHGHD